MRWPLGFARQRWVVLALAASLVLNGFFAGLLLTDSLRGKRRPDGPRVVGWELRRLSDRLPSEALDRIRQDLFPMAGDFDRRFQELRAEREAISRLAAEPEPDRQAIDARLARIREESAQLQADVQRAVYDALLRLPPEQRAPLAEPARSG